MELKEPKEKFSFEQHHKQVNGRMELVIIGSSSPPSNYYTIGTDQIIDIYNESRHPRGGPELNSMGHLNEVYWTGTMAEMVEVIDYIKTEHRQKAPDMWDKVFRTYLAAKAGKK